MAQNPRPARKPVVSRIGKTEIVKLGTQRLGFRDAYYLIHTLSSRAFFGSMLSIYLLANLTFATLYFVGDHAIANARPGSFSDCFFFSVETLATVGYGEMSPGTLYGHIVATVEIVTGMMSLATITGLMFARFSKPTTRALFSRVAVVTLFNGEPMLMLRVANERRNSIVEASATLTLSWIESTLEGPSFRRVYDLKLERSRSSLFALSWSIMHRIDQASPLYGVDAAALAAQQARLLVSIAGIDESMAATVHARFDYSHDAILFGQRFVDVVRTDPDERVYVDLARFHDVEPLDAMVQPQTN
ncbi:MAG TPA: ion channel [Xanthomonadaceae bacterium]|jgi:inward rectifier potassium channel|nr:ion channel [Xanthomonadaceae bacterium]